MKEYKVFAFQENGRWLYHLVDIATWNEVILTESQLNKCVSKGIKII